MLNKSARFLTLLLPLAFVACGGSNKPTEASPAPTQATVAAKGCAGSYVGTIDKPSLEVRLAALEESKRCRGIRINPPEDGIDPIGPSEGIWMEGNFAFETDTNCKVVKGGTNIFYTYPYAIEGTVKADRSFDMVFTGSGSIGEFVGQINPDDSISGQLKHPAPDDYVYGLLNGKFTPNGKI